MGDEGVEDRGPGGNDFPSGYVASECEACGKRFKLRKWREGIKCPKCKDGKLAPLLADGGAVDYCVADRSEGYARADIRFAQWAKWAELITPRQYDQAFAAQNRIVKKKENPPPIHEFMVEEGWISEKQALGLLEFMCRERPDEDDRQFARAVVEAGEAGSGEVEKVSKLQEKIAQKANETPPLCQLMFEKRILSESAVVSLLRMLRKKGQGPLYSVAESTGKPPRIKTRKHGTRKAARENIQTIKRVAFVAILFLLAAGVWYWQGRETPYMFIALCESCGETNRMAWESSFPLECPDCGEAAAYNARVCEEGHVFPGRPYHSISCPECGSTTTRSPEEEDLQTLEEGNAEP